LGEYLRKGNFVRVYPAQGSDHYDHYFQSIRPYNKYLYKVLYGDEIQDKRGEQAAAKNKTTYKLDFPNSYEYYKTKMQKEQEQSKEDQKEATHEKSQPSIQEDK